MRLLVAMHLAHIVMLQKTCSRKGTHKQQNKHTGPGVHRALLVRHLIVPLPDMSAPAASAVLCRLWLAADLAV